MKSPKAECAMTVWAVLITSKVEEIADGVANKNCVSPAAWNHRHRPHYSHLAYSGFGHQWIYFVQSKPMTINEILIAADSRKKKTEIMV
jgi:hypothetical protein